MLDLGGSFSGFLDALFSLLNEFLGGLFGFLASLLSGINISF